MSLESVVIVGLAAWRLAYLLVKEAGPGNLLLKLRQIPAVQRFGLLNCVYCVSIWLALGGWLLYPVAPALVQVLAVAAVAAMVQRWLGFDFETK